MKNTQIFASILGMKATSFSTQISQIRRDGKWSKKWQSRFEFLAHKLDKTVPEILFSLGIKNNELIKIGPRTFTYKEYLKKQNTDEWCWKTIHESTPSHRWTLTLCLSPIFPLLKKIEALKMWVESKDHDDFYLVNMLHIVYMYAFEEVMEFSWINSLLSEAISVDVRIAAAKRANQGISRLSPEDLQKLTAVT